MTKYLIAIIALCLCLSLFGEAPSAALYEEHRGVFAIFFPEDSGADSQSLERAMWEQSGSVPQFQQDLQTLSVLASKSELPVKWTDQWGVRNLFVEMES